METLTWLLHVSLNSLNQERTSRSNSFRRNSERLVALYFLGEEAVNFDALLLSQMNAEVKTPLITIMQSADGLQDGTLSVEHQRGVKRIREAAGTLFFRINNLLDLKNLGDHSLALHPQSFNLRSLLHVLEGVISLKSVLAQCEFLLNLENQVPADLRGDPLRVGQIILNLVDRSLRFAPGAAIILFVRVIADQDQRVTVQFTATDSGIAFEQDIETVFTNTAQVHEYMLRTWGDSGMELAITFELIRLMGGTLSVRALRKKGTAISVDIPFEKLSLAERVTSVVQETPATKSVHCLKILVVDDNEVNRKLLDRMLSKQGHTIVLAADGQEAVDEFKKQSFDLILMDLKMPVMDGLEAGRQIRELEKVTMTRTPLIAVTAEQYDDYWPKCKALGFDDFINKPIIFRNLWKTINHVLETPSPINC